MTHTAEFTCPLCKKRLVETRLDGLGVCWPCKRKALKARAEKEKK